ncbi:hypothetical protein ACFLTB_04940, partial [Chloroflexota bacterium]
SAGIQGSSMPNSITAEHLYRENLEKAEEIRKKSDKTPEQLYGEREKRVRDAIQLKEPDRVPVRLETHSFPAHYVGILDPWIPADIIPLK